MDLNLEKEASDSEDDSIHYASIDPNLEDEDDESITENHEDLQSIEHYYQLDEPDTVYIRRFNSYNNQYRIRFRNMEDIKDLNTKIGEIFDHAIKKLLDNLPENSMIGAQFSHPGLKGRPVLITFRPKGSILGETMVAQIQKVLQSKEEITLDTEEGTLSFTVVPLPNGSGHHDQNMFIKHKQFLDRKRSIIQIKNNDDLCLARAIVVAIARIHKKSPIYRWHAVRKGDEDGCSVQKDKAIKLMNLAGLADHVGACGLPELEKIQNVLPDYQIKVFDDRFTTEPIFEGLPTIHIVHLYNHDSHYDIITTPTGFFNHGYFCEHCNQAYNTKERHRCNSFCPCCHSTPACKDTAIILCPDCNRYFRNNACFTNHQKKIVVTRGKGKKRQKIETSLCMRLKKCKECSKHINDSYGKHKCGEFFCRTCKKQILMEGHLCYMQPIIDNDDDQEETWEEYDESSNDLISEAVSEKDPKEKAPLIYIFFDFETMQDRIYTETRIGHSYLHIVNLCIAHVVCELCMMKSPGMCPRCGDNRKIFQGETSVTDFCDYVFSLTRSRRIIAIAHNAKGFDGQFILQYLIEQGMKPKIISQGTKIMTLMVGKNFKLIDSFNFMPMALASLPKAFGISELAKGYFPHMFNTKQTQSYIGCWPDIYYYGAANMMSTDREKFLEWYKQQLTKTFDFREEIIKYCESDVDVLRQCCLKFREMFIEETTMDPFEHSITIASACNRVFRKLYLKPNTIGIVPHKGYGRRLNQSVKALKWIKWLSESQDILIRHKLNGGEVKIEPFTVDGFDETTNTIYEFYGCYWHGCQTCMKKRNQPTSDQFMTAQEAYEQTISRKMILMERGYKLVEIWECQFTKQLAENPEMREFCSKIHIREPMDPREAFYGGRTNAVKLYHKIKVDEAGEPLEKIHYVDVCSLYPYTNKYCEYPIGHPTIITEGFQDVKEDCLPYNGIVFLKILPPKKLYHPVLPFRSNGKLTFPLCSACALCLNQEGCSHDSEERALTGKWPSVEIKKALELGYKIIDIYEVWHYDQWAKYTPQNPDASLFARYINTFLKLKIAAEGWPSWVENIEDKNEYMADLFTREGIMLESDNVEKNPGKRAIAKLMLNSFWGKFGQRNNLKKVEYCSNPTEFYRILCDPANIVHSIHAAGLKMMCVNYCQQDDFVEVMSNTNPVIAAFTTAHARLKLYSYLEKLKARVLYMDTDSIIYFKDMRKKEQYMVPTGWCLGEMTNELKEYGTEAYISEFVSSGPKSYAFKVTVPGKDESHYVVKIKGFTLSHITSKYLNFKSLHRMVLDYVKKEENNGMDIASWQIIREKDTHRVLTMSTSKLFQIVYEKRILKRNFYTFPYGYA